LFNELDQPETYFYKGKYIVKTEMDINKKTFRRDGERGPSISSGSKGYSSRQDIEDVLKTLLDKFKKNK
jgi:hypothetical protein